MKTDFTIRQAQQLDAVELKELFQNTVLVINRRDYTGHRTKRIKRYIE